MIARCLLGFVLVFWPAIAHSQQAPSAQPTPHEQERTTPNQKKSEPPNTPAKIMPSIIDFFFPKGLEKISEYCAKHTDTEPDKWLHEKFICDVRSTDVLIAGFTALLFFATIILAVAAGCQFEITRRTARRQLKAYIFISRAEINDITTSDFKISLVVNNFGQTPADKTVINGRVEISKFPLDFSSLPPHNIVHLKNMTIGPGGVHTIIITRPAAFSAEEVARLRTSDSAIYVYGKIEYRDIFNKPRETRYCFYKGGDLGISGSQLNTCKDGNKAR